MAKCVIGFGDLVVNGTIVASSAVPTLPATNLQDSRLGRVWRATATSAALTVDFGVRAAVGWIAFRGCNLTLTSTRQIRLSISDTTGLSGDAHNSGSGAASVDPWFGQMVYILPADVSARYLRLDLSDASLPYIQGGWLGAGATLRPATNYGMGAQNVRRSLSQFRQAEDGSGYGDKRPVQRGFKISLPRLTTFERDNYFEPMLDISDITDNVLFCKDPASTNMGRDTVVGTLEALPAVTNAHFDWHSAEMTIWERR